MKTALVDGSQHREKDVNDLGGKGINNAGLPFSLCPNVPLTPSFPFPLSLPSTSTLLYITPSFFIIHCLHSSFVLLFCQVTDLTSRGSSPHQAYVASPPLSCPAGRRFEIVHQPLAFLSKVLFDEVELSQLVAH